MGMEISFIPLAFARDSGGNQLRKGRGAISDIRTVGGERGHI